MKDLKINIQVSVPSKPFQSRKKTLLKLFSFNTSSSTSMLINNHYFEVRFIDYAITLQVYFKE